MSFQEIDLEHNATLESNADGATEFLGRPPMAYNVWGKHAGLRPDFHNERV